MYFLEELFSKYNIRRKKKQKTEFIKFVYSFCKRKGYEINYNNDSINRNIILGDIKKANILLTAHYDTPNVSPISNFSIPSWKGYIVKLLITFIILVIAIIPIMGIYMTIYIVISIIYSILHITIPIFSTKIFIGGFPLFYFFLTGYSFFLSKPNRNNYNDNTSGVSVLLEIIENMPKEALDKVAFVFFDNEEKGLLGAKELKRTYNIDESKLIINFDCVAVGDYFMLYKKKNTDIELLSELVNKHCKIYNKHYFVKTNYLGKISASDHNVFKNSIGISAFTKKSKILYFGRIHTKRDTLYYEDNIKCLVDSMLEYISISD